MISYYFHDQSYNNFEIARHADFILLDTKNCHSETIFRRVYTIFCPLDYNSRRFILFLEREFDLLNYVSSFVRDTILIPVLGNHTRDPN